MDALTDIFDEIELKCHEYTWISSCDESIREWNNKSKKITINNKKSKKYQWHSPRCGFIVDNKYCTHKIHFSGLEKRQKHDVDIYDRKLFCYIHKQNRYSEYEKQNIKMEKIILERIQNQKEFFITDNNKQYIEMIKQKYKHINESYPQGASQESTSTPQ